MAERPVAVIRTGVANLASVLAGLRRAGAAPEVTSDPDVVRRADRVMLPGVGAFGAGMAALVAAGLGDALIERIGDDRPLLAVCLGLQLLCADSDEAPGVAGLGIVPARVHRFADDLIVPQLGWNRLVPTTGARLVAEPGWAYYANSYRLDGIPDGWEGATSVHGGRFVGALERGHTLACQFHPELSGAWGHALLTRWVADGGR